ncbi:MAG: hypothetical protein U5L76_02895 [Patescibacteria group bacterium]|nr:hypothetical protein [Patescibacteria group bacterium]
MNQDKYKEIRLIKRLENLFEVLIVNKPERLFMVKKIKNLSYNNLTKLLGITLKSKENINFIAKIALEKNNILKKNDKKSWLEMMKKEEKELDKNFSKIIEKV